MHSHKYTHVHTHTYVYPHKHEFMSRQMHTLVYVHTHEDAHVEQNINIWCRQSLHINMPFERDAAFPGTSWLWLSAVWWSIPQSLRGRAVMEAFRLAWAAVPFCGSLTGLIEQPARAGEGSVRACFGLHPPKGAPTHAPRSHALCGKTPDRWVGEGTPGHLKPGHSAW